MSYQFRKSGRYTVNAEVVGPELERIWHANGEQLSASAVVDAARSEESVLHSVFEWDDSIAGERYREAQARNLIRSVRIVAQDGERRPVFVNVKVEKNQSSFYQRLDVAVQRPDEFLSALLILQRKLTELTASVEELQLFAKGQNRGEADLQKIIAIAEALATAKLLTQRLQ